MAVRYDWDKVKKEYIEGVRQPDGSVFYPTLRDLAQKYGCVLSTAGRRCAKEQWNIQRERFANKVEHERKQRKAESLSEEATRYDLACFRISRDGVEKAEKMLAECTKPSDFVLLTRALKDLQQVAKTAIGDTSAPGGNEMRIEVRLDED